MKFMQKKYPLLVSTIVSCVIIVVSLFILGFFGLKLSVSLGGGSRMEVNLEQNAIVKEAKDKVGEVLSKHHISIDSSFVEDKYVAGADDETEYLRKCLVIQVAKKGISAEEKAEIKSEIAQALGTNPAYVSEMQEITSSVTAKEVLFVALAVGIIAICFFIFAWIRYNVFAGISFVLSFLHNIILFLSLIILTRVQLSVISLIIVLIMTLVMSIVLVNIYEKFKETSKLSSSDKIPVSELMLSSEKQVVMPYAIILATALLCSLMLLIVPANMVKIASVSGIYACVITAYTSLIIGPASYAAVLEIRDMNQKAQLSRNDTVNKTIQKKIKKNSKTKS